MSFLKHHLLGFCSKLGLLLLFSFRNRQNTERVKTEGQCEESSHIYGNKKKPTLFIVQHILQKEKRAPKKKSNYTPPKKRTLTTL